MTEVGKKSDLNRKKKKKKKPSFSNMEMKYYLLKIDSEIIQEAQLKLISISMVFEIQFVFLSQEVKFKGFHQLQVGNLNRELNFKNRDSL